MRLFLRVIAACLALSLPTAAVSAGDIKGAGATFPEPIYAKWSEAYRAETGTGLDYRPLGSAGGIKQIVSRSVTFGASDKPLNEKELDAAGLIQFPMIMGGVVAVFNLPRVKPGALVLDGDTLAKIFLGEIARWDDPAIAALNKGLDLPAEDISVVHRSDGSGTTYCFTSYLAGVSPAWKEKIGAESAVEWPVGTGAKRNDGVAKAVARTEGAIGYVEFATAAAHGLSFAAMINRDGKTVLPGMATFQAAAGNADWTSGAGSGLMLTDQPGANSWPITAASYVLMPVVAADGPAAAEALKFFDWAYRKGGKLAEELAYVPMPENVVEFSRAEWARLKDSAGKPVLTSN